ncbi:MAG: hypothetical protein R2695_17150 [Acidimicrobiales bacterium]
MHEGAIYLHRRQAFEVIRLDLERAEARVVVTDDDLYTQARSETDITVLSIDRKRDVGGAILHLGAVEVTSQVTGFQRRDARSRRIISHEALDLPSRRLVTRAFWYTFDPETVRCRRPRRCGHAPRPGARGDRAAPPVHDLRPVGCRRRLDARHRDIGAADGLHLRRISRWRGDRRVGLGGRSRTPRRDPHGDRGMPVPRRVPLVRAVAEVRQRQRTTRQVRRRTSDRRRARRLTGARTTGLGRSSRRQGPIGPFTSPARRPTGRG